MFCKIMYIKSLYLLFFVVSLSSQYSQASGSLPCDAIRWKQGRVRLRIRGKLAKFTCPQRYEMVGHRYSSCTDGKWDVPFPVCVRSGCKTDFTVDNGLIVKSRNDAWVNFFCLPGHKIQGSPTIYCDGRNWNATAPTCVEITDASAQPNLSCDFETPDICSWQQDEFHDFDWRRLNKKTPSHFLNTGPSYDHTLGVGKSGHYMYIESTAKNVYDKARLISPIYDSALAKNGCFSFFYHMYGMSVGGLRVYQKPDKLTLQSLLELTTAEKQKYILFEKFTNQGDTWYQSVTNLTDFNDDFQIVIEGIRGYSYTSDIAIDDVAILQGNNCTKAIQGATTPSKYVYDSCNNKCNHEDEEGYCSCLEDCNIRGTCCADYFDVCFFSAASTPGMDTSESVYAEVDMPQTQKLVGTTIIPTRTPSTNITTPTTKPTIVTTIKTTTVDATKATAHITTPKTQPKPKLVFKTTTPIYNATGVLVRDNTTKVQVKTNNTTTGKPTTTKPTTAKPTTMKATTTKPTTVFNHGVSRTFENHNQYHDLVEEAKNRKKIEIDSRITKIAEKIKEPSTGSRTLLIILAVLVCGAGVACLVYGGRTERGRAAVARLRGRVTHDSEVRFLTQSEDE